MTEEESILETSRIGTGLRSEPENEPGWQWSDERVLETVNAVRAGRSLQPETWPGGARVAVLLSFDVDNETVLGLRYGDATVGSLSQGQFGARVALPRVVDLLDREGIPASFFIPAVSLVLNPFQVDIIQAAGHHEFAIHGWIHELNSSLDAETERALLERAVDYMTDVTGVRPLGYRAPSWNFSPNTLDIIREMGFLYDSSLMADDRPYEINAHGEPTGLVELPVEWILDDAPVFNPRGGSYSHPRDVLQVVEGRLRRRLRRRHDVPAHHAPARDRAPVPDRGARRTDPVHQGARGRVVRDAPGGGAVCEGGGGAVGTGASAGTDGRHPPY